MPIIRTGFRESKASRKKFESGTKIKLGKLSNDIRIVDIKELEYKDKMGFVFIEYEYAIEYNLDEPKDDSWGNLHIVGEILYADTEEMIKNLIKDWQTDKKIDKDILALVVRNAMNEAQIEAIVQAKKVGLPSPVPMPKLKMSSPEKTNAS